MTQVEPTPHHRFRVAHDVEWAALDRLDLIHVGQSSALLDDPNRGVLVPLTWAGRGLAPGGFALEGGDGPRLCRLLQERQREHGTSDLSSWRQAAAGQYVVTDLRLPALPIDRAAARRARQLLAADERPWSDATMDPSAQRALAPLLAAAVVDGDAHRTGTVARALIGSGPGATPAGDDVIVGVLAGLHLASAQGLLRSDPARRARRLLEAVVAEGLPRTTAASRHQLSAAVRGSFAERCLHMAYAISDIDSVEPAHHAALGWGATSGIDFLHGLVSAAHSVLEQGAVALSATG